MAYSPLPCNIQKNSVTSSTMLSTNLLIHCEILACSNKQCAGREGGENQCRTFNVERASDEHILGGYFRSNNTPEAPQIIP